MDKAHCGRHGGRSAPIAPFPDCKFRRFFFTLVFFAGAE